LAYASLWNGRNRRLRLLLVLVAAVSSFTFAVAGSPIVASANYSTAQIAVDDDSYVIYSVYIDCSPFTGMSGCQNQFGQEAHHCFNIPEPYVHIYNWWWVGTPEIRTFGQNNCAGTYTGYLSATIVSASQSTPWYCTSSAYGGLVC